MASQTTAVALIGTLARSIEMEDSHLETMHDSMDWSLYSISRAVFPEERPSGTEFRGTSAAVSRLRLDTVAHQN